jgi:hypothetical protein
MDYTYATNHEIPEIKYLAWDQHPQDKVWDEHDIVLVHSNG